MKAEGAKVLRRALEGSLGGGGVSARLVIGNRRSLDLAAETGKRLTSLENRQARIEASLASRDNQLASQRMQNVAFENKNIQLSQMNIQQDQINITQAQINNQQAQINSTNDMDIGALKDRVLDLTLSSKEYGRLRQRFLSMYKRKAKMTLSDEDQRIIKEGDLVSHFGNAIADARLYSTGARRDDEIFQELYGVTVEVLPSLSECFPKC